MSSVWTLDNPAFVSYVFYSTVLGLKMLLLAPLTGYMRMSRGAFANPEDAKNFKAKGGVPKIDPDVERVRRAHQNDLENIPLFFLFGLVYLLTEPSTFLATMLFRVFTVCRIFHSVLYLNESTLRPFSFIIPELISVYMAGSVIYHFW